jgi:hypothetical protein
LPHADVAKKDLTPLRKRTALGATNVNAKPAKQQRRANT